MKQNHFYLVLFLFLITGCKKLPEKETYSPIVEKSALPADMTTEKSGPPSLIVSTVGGTGTDFNQYDGFARYAEMNMPFGLSVDASNNIIMADLANNAIRSLSPSLTLTTLAGNGIAGFVNGPAITSKFNVPYDVDVNSAGDIIVCDYINSCIRKITPAGIVSTLAGNGYGFTDGPVSIASFRNPTSVAIDPSGNMIVCDHNNNAIRKITPLGMVSTVAGNGGYGNNDGPGPLATFFLPNCVAVDNAGNIFVTDGTANHCIRRIDAATNIVSTIAGGPYMVGYQDGPCSTAKFFGPHGILVDPMQNLVIADAGNSAIRKIDLSTNTVSTLTGSPTNTGYLDGPASVAQFYNCQDITFDNNGDLIIAEPTYPRLRKLSGGNVTTICGDGKSGFQDGNAGGALASFYYPFDVGVDGNNNIFVGDYHFRQISFSGVVTTLNQLFSPFYSNLGVTNGMNGDKIVSKQTCVFRVSAAGVVTLIAGGPTSGYVDANGASAMFSDIRGLVMDASGNIYVADYGGYTVRKIDVFNNVTTFAGSPNTPGYVDGAGTAARFYSPWGMDIDAAQNIYLADQYKIRKMDLSGNVTTLLNSNANIMDMANDGQGNFAFVSWSPFSTVSFVKKLDAFGNVTTLAGTPTTQGYLDGPASTAQFKTLYGITIDQKRNIIVADPENGMIRKVSGNW